MPNLPSAAVWWCLTHLDRPVFIIHSKSLEFLPTRPARQMPSRLKNGLILYSVQGNLHFPKASLARPEAILILATHPPEDRAPLVRWVEEIRIRRVSWSATSLAAVISASHSRMPMNTQLRGIALANDSQKVASALHFSTILDT